MAIQSVWRKTIGQRYRLPVRSAHEVPLQLADILFERIRRDRLADHIIVDPPNDRPTSNQPQQPPEP
jgi:hypothetical protein